MVNENLTTQKSNKVPDWLNSAIWSTPPQPPPPPSSTVVSAAIDPYDPPFSRPDRHHIRRHNSDDADDVYDSPPSALPKPKTRAPKADSNGTSTSNGSDSIAVVSSAPTPEDISRHAQLLVEVSKKVINMKEVRRLAAMGVSDGPGVRSTVWKLLLGYLPSDRSMWPMELAKKRLQYNHFKDDLLMTPVLSRFLPYLACNWCDFCSVSEELY